MIKDILIDNIYEILIITIEILNFFKKIMTASSFVSLKSMIATSWLLRSVEMETEIFFNK